MKEDLCQTKPYNKIVVKEAIDVTNKLNSCVGSLSPETIWDEMAPFTGAPGVCNFGMGYPNFPPPLFVRECLVDQATDVSYATHQYPRALGDLSLVHTLQEQYKTMLHRDIADDEILITNGVTHALSAVLYTFVNPGDEIIVFLPAYDLYFIDIALCGAKGVYIPLKADTDSADNWTFDQDILENAVTSKTKFIIINSPQNVPGKVFTLDELKIIADIAIKHNIFVISDDIYMHFTYNNAKFSNIAAFPGMFERTFVMCSFGKTFACTGWRVGWVISSRNVINAINTVAEHQNFGISTPMQRAAGRVMVLARTNGYIEEMRKRYEENCNILIEMVESAGLKAVRPSGGFFLVADISNVREDVYLQSNDTTRGKDFHFCKWLSRELGVCPIPVSAFVTPEVTHIYENFVRFAFCKEKKDILEGGYRLQKLRQYLK